jgi:hypothetical protein
LLFTNGVRLDNCQTGVDVLARPVREPHLNLGEKPLVSAFAELERLRERRVSTRDLVNRGSRFTEQVA